MTQVTIARTTAARAGVERSRATAVLVSVAVVAVLVRLLPYLQPGALTEPREYDDAVAWTGARALAAGGMPYRDFVFLHPPGVLLAMLPFGLGSGGDDAVRLGVARLAVVALGAVNAVLVAYLLRRVGLAAMLVGGLGYAVWGAAAFAERTVLLEPGINLGLLLALVALQRRGRHAMTWAGLALGAACAVKYWAVVDVAVVLAWVVARGRAQGTWRYLAGVVVGAGAVAGPFFLLAPTAMWQQTVSTQLGRPVAGVALAERGRSFSPLSGLDLPDSHASGWIWIAVLVVVLVAGLSPLAAAVVRRVRPSDWRDEWWWAVLATVHVAVLLVSASFYYHYAAWAAAPLTLVGGAAAGRLWRRVPAFPHRTAAVWAVVAVAVLGVAAVAAPRASGLFGDPAPARAAVTEWATGRTCVWGSAKELVWADAASRNLEHGCGVFVDGYGAYLADGAAESGDGLTANPEWASDVAVQLASADGAVLPADPDLWWLGGQQRAEFEHQFVLVDTVGDVGIWDRAPHGG